MINKHLFKQKYHEYIISPHERVIMDYHDDIRKMDMYSRVVITVVILSVLGPLTYGILFDGGKFQTYAAMVGMAGMTFSLIYFLMDKIHQKKRDRWREKRDELSDVVINRLFEDVGVNHYTYKPQATMQESVVNKLRNVVIRSHYAEDANIIDIDCEVSTTNGSIYYVDIEHETKEKRRDSDGTETTERKIKHLYHGLYGLTPIRDTDHHADIDSFFMMSVHRGRHMPLHVRKSDFYQTDKYGDVLYVTSTSDDITQHILAHPEVQACLMSPQFEMFMISYGYVHIFYRTHNDVDVVQYGRTKDKPFDIFREMSDQDDVLSADEYMYEDVNDITRVNQVLRVFD